MANIKIEQIGNVVSPSGSSIILGKTSNATYTDIEVEHDETYNPYSIVCVEDEEDGGIVASQVDYTPTGNLTSTNVQSAITEVEELIYNSVPTFSLETVTLTEGATSANLTKTFSATAMMVFYNGLLINNGIHYTFSGKTITLSDFTAEANDILTVIGLASNGGSNNINATELIGEAY